MEINTIENIDIEDDHVPIEVPEETKAIMRDWWRKRIMPISHAGTPISEGLTICDDTHHLSATLPYGHIISLQELQTTFGTSGHAFSIDFTKSYVVPLWLDIDCRHDFCGEGQSTNIANNGYIKQIDEIVFTLLNVRVNRNVFFKLKKCSLHIYYEASVSSLLLYQIIKTLINRLPLIILERYTIDMFSHLALPFSLKNSEMYRPMVPNYIEIPITASTKPYFDVNHILLTRNIPEHYFDIGYFKFGDGSDLDVEWSEFDLHDQEPLHLLLPSEWSTGLKRILPKYNIEAPFVSSYLECNLVTYLNRHLKITQKISNLQLDTESPYFRPIAKIARKMANAAYHETFTENDDVSVFNTLLQIMREPNDTCGYAWYILLAITKWCADSVEATDLDLIKREVFDFFEKLTLNNTIIQHYLRTNRNVKLMSVMNNLFTAVRVIRPTSHGMSHENDKIESFVVKWIAPICKQILHRKYKFENLFRQTSQPRTEYELKKEGVRFLSKGAAAYRDLPNSQSIYVFENGMYVEHRQDKIASISIAAKLDSFIRDVHREMHNDVNWGGSMKPNKLKEVILSDWFDSLPVISNMPKNLIPFIISTTLGNFLTISGLYMAKVPFFHFTTAKQYAIDYNINNPSQIIINLKNDQNIIEYFFKHLPKLFITTTLVPGLSLLHLAIFDPTRVIPDFFKMFMDFVMKQENERSLLDLFLPLLKVYQMDIKKLLDLAQAIHLTSGICSTITFGLINKTRTFILEPPRNPIGDVDYNSVVQITGESTYYEDYELCTMEEFILNTEERFNVSFTEVDDRVYITYTSLATAMCMAIIQYEFVDIEWHESLKVISTPATPLEIDLLQGTSALQSYFTEKLQLPLSESTASMLYSFCLYFRFDGAVLFDFFSFLSMIYQPSATRKFITILLGELSCGKSTIIRHITGSNAGSCLSTVKSLTSADAADAPSPSTIRLYNSYVAAIAEISTLNTVLAKAITGSDTKDMRGLFDLTLKEYKPLPFIVAAANSIPKTLSYSDDAIKSRMAFFRLPTQFLTLKPDLNNILLQFVMKVTPKEEMTTNTEKDAIFANLIFAFFTNQRNPNTAILTPILKNEDSLELVQEFMYLNNPFWDMLRYSGLKIDANLTTTLEEISSHLETGDIITQINTRTKKNYSQFDALCQIQKYIAPYLATNVNHTYFGIGYGETTASLEFMMSLDYSENSKLTGRDLRKKLVYYIYHEPNAKVEANVKALQQKYATYYNSSTDTFTGLSYPKSNVV